MGLGPDLLTQTQQAMVDLSHGQLPDKALVTLLISKMLGYTIVAGACIVKFPQIINILKSHSADGLSMIAFEMELVGLVIQTTYGLVQQLPFSAYGEAIVLLLQQIVLVALIYNYNRAGFQRPVVLAALLATGLYMLQTGMLTKEFMEVAYDFNSVIFTVARLPQITKNFYAKSTGQLSIATYVANLLGCLARMFTSLQEGGGMAMVRGFLMGFVLNGVLVAQILIYGNKKAAAPAPTKKTI